MDKKNIKTKLTNSDFKNLPLAEYYANLPTATRVVTKAPKDDLLDEIAAVTGRTRETARTWCLGQITPARHVQKKLAKHFKTTPENLFPTA